MAARKGLQNGTTKRKLQKAKNTCKYICEKRVCLCTMKQLENFLINSFKTLISCSPYCKISRRCAPEKGRRFIVLRVPTKPLCFLTQMGKSNLGLVDAQGKFSMIFTINHVWEEWGWVCGCHQKYIFFVQSQDKLSKIFESIDERRSIPSCTCLLEPWPRLANCINRK